jgi:hypothetical protein
MNIVCLIYIFVFISIVLHFTTEDKFVLVVSLSCLWKFTTVKAIPLNFMFL